MKQRSLFDKIRGEKPTPRPYQQKGIDELRALVARNILKICLVCPTGGGKTVIASAIIDMARQLDKRVLFCAHRIELINQTAIQLAKFGVTDIGVIRSQDQRADDKAPVQIASIDTLRNRDKPKADIVFIDEAHRSLSQSYLDLIAYYNEALLIGLTATPFRTDNQGLGEVYQGLVVCATPSQLVEDKFIVAPRVFCAPELPDLSNVEVVYGTHDFHNNQLASVMSQPKILGNLIQEWKAHAKNRRTVCFAVSVEHSKKIVEEFRQAGVPAAHIDGTTSAQDRETILLKLEKYELQLVSNCDVLSEGWDQPSVKCAILARPTNSTRLHLQQCGRILRTIQSDPIGDLYNLPKDALILDHAGNCLRHGLPQQDRIYDLQTGQHKKELGPSLHVCKKCFAMWAGTARKCPECGEEKEIKERSEIVADTNVKLQEVTEVKILTLEDQQRQFFLKQLTICRDTGKKPGAASFKFKEKFGKWPPYAWSQQAKQYFESQPDWQEAVSKRSEVRHFWQQRMEDKREAIENPSAGPDPGFVEEPEESDWWDQFKSVEADEEIPF